MCMFYIKVFFAQSAQNEKYNTYIEPPIMDRLNNDTKTFYFEVLSQLLYFHLQREDNFSIEDKIYSWSQMCPLFGGSNSLQMLHANASLGYDVLST